MEKNNEEIVYQKLKNAIIKRYIRQGCKLVETSLAKQLEVSRTPVRGAIRRLVYDGFAVYEPNKGACVIEPTPEEIQETFFVRRQLEKKGAAMAAGRITREEVGQLRQHLASEEKIFQERDLDEYYRINDAIHLLIARASGNRVMYHYIKDLLDRTKIFLILYDPFYTMPINPSIHEHRRVVAALEARDADLARSAMDTHLKSAFQGMDLQVLPEDYIAL